MRLIRPLTKYVDRLPFPPVAKPSKKENGVTCYSITMEEVQQKLHRDLPPTTVWGYNGVYPGPTFEANRNENVHVTWKNNLPSEHLLPVDKTIHGACPTEPEVRTVVHLHGGVNPAKYDGLPEAWFTRNFKKTGPRFVSSTYKYPNIQEATTLWYHDHALGITRLNVYSGLAGFYLLRDTNEQKLNLPKGKYEIPMVIQDRSFNQDGSLFYPRQPEDGVIEPNLPDPSVVPEFFGDTILVNGKVWPFLEVEQRKYRFRILNGSNSRFYKMKLSSGQPFIHIGTDQGFLEKPVKVKEVILGSGERIDIILDFSKIPVGTNIILTNTANSPFPFGDAPDPNTTGQIMQFRVVPLKSKDNSSIPSKLNTIPKLKVSQARRVRNMTLNENTDQFGRLQLLLNNKEWAERADTFPLLNSIEVWNLINLTPDTHPIHPHLIRFQILNRQPFDVNHYELTGKLRFTGPPVKPEVYERGWKDVVRANPGEVTRFIARFEPFADRYPWHCHIIEHEDHEMMRPFTVVTSNFFKKKICNKTKKE